MIKFIYLDILYPELWLEDAMQYAFRIDIEEDLIQDEPVNLQFKEFGYQSKQFIKNSGSSLVFLILFFIYWLIIILIFKLSRFSKM